MKIVSATRSPMNFLRWFLELDCGHDLWVTRKKKPKGGGNFKCPKGCTPKKRPEGEK